MKHFWNQKLTVCCLMQQKDATIQICLFDGAIPHCLSDGRLQRSYVFCGFERGESFKEQSS